MELIGAGLPRTATLTQKVALEMLGMGPCYHMVDVLGDLSRVGPWTSALAGNGDWSTIFSGFRATVDWPASFFYPELIEIYPNAKILLSVRDSTAWAESMRETLWGVMYGDTLLHDLAAARSHIEPAWRAYTDLMTAIWEKSGLLAAGTDDLDTTALARVFERYNAEVRASVPADRLLVWSPADGWAPLCEFLEVPVPQVPLPALNDSKMFADRVIESSLAALSQWRNQQAAIA